MTDRGIAVVVSDRVFAETLPDAKCLKTFARPTEKLLDRWRNVFVLASFTELDGLADFITEANNRHLLRGLLIRDDHATNLLPQVFQLAGLRTLRNTLVHSGGDVPRRVLTAYCTGAEDELIADARVTSDRLFVISCAGETFSLAFEEISFLDRIPEARRSDFVLDEDGSYVFWPACDLHVTLEDIRTSVDPDYRARGLSRTLQANESFGGAVSKLRRAAGLSQASIPGVSERQVRRIEKGETSPSVATLESLAAAHNLTLNEYLDQLANSLSESDATSHPQRAIDDIRTD